jgi:hypothetical protein
VFAAVLSVLLAALTMAYAVNVDRIVADRMAEVNRRVQADALASSKVALAAEEQARLNERIAQLEAQTAQLNSTIANLQNERTSLISDKTTAVNEAQSVMNKIDQLAATNKTQALLIESYRNEVTKLRENELGYRRREIELTDRLNDLESQREVLDGSVRALQEQLVEAQRQIQQGGNAARTGTAQAPYTPSFPVSAKIVNVSRDPATQQPMATIDVGTNNQIQKNMQLVVTHNGQYIADFIVTRADLNWAQGNLDFHGQKNTQVQPGDQVRSLTTASR